ncbi:hypothetical protein MTO96_046593, partial [Rhipicephalus appendiculatus]
MKSLRLTALFVGLLACHGLHASHAY